MKVVVITILIALVLVFFLTPSTTVKKNSCVRIHIRANSNSIADQNVKFIVKDAVVDFLADKLQDCENQTQAKQVIMNNSHELQQLALNSLRVNGFSYSARVRLNEEFFMEKSYQGVRFEEGLYSALIIELGSGEGDNWWCVAFPPLCFIEGQNNGSTSIEYKSILVELIEHIFG